MDFNLIQHQQIQENADILSDQEEAYELDDPESRFLSLLRALHDALSSNSL